MRSAAWLTHACGCALADVCWMSAALAENHASPPRCDQLAGGASASKASAAASPAAGESPAPAAERSSVPNPAVDHLSIEPSPLVLRGPRDRAQLLVTAHMADGSLRDVTAAARIELAPGSGKAVELRGAQVRPVADGQGRIRATLRLAGDRTLLVEGAPAAPGPEAAVEAAARVERFGVEPTINFANDIEPMLTKAGCNSGGCHGKQGGQNGFALSLLGFDPEADYDSIVKRAHGRRVFPAAPERSLMLTKPTGQAPHGGGRRFDADSESAALVRRWIEQGMPLGDQKDPYVIKIEAVPRERLLPRHSQQQLRVLATLSDNSIKDVSDAAEYKSQQPDLVAVTATGAATTLDTTGEGTIMVRYMGLVDVARLTIPYGGQLSESAYAGFQARTPVDELALKKWRKLGIAPSPLCSDAEFIRRASLDAIGTLPTGDEIRAFLADAEPVKRARLVDRLLERNEYASYWSNIWGDLLRNKRRNGEQSKRGTYAFAAWIRDAFATNMPYDQFVAAILTAQGTVSDNPPVVWYREVRNTVGQVNDTAQLFMGTRVNCANCHHHPYERWGQDDYWGMAAFFGRLGTKPGEVSGESAVYVRKDGGVNQPRTGKSMKPKALGGPEYEYVHGEDPRRLLADWLTQRDNPYFAPAIVNRMWARLMGVGLVEAVDDMRVTNPASNPELLDYLARDFVERHFDLKHLVRRIMTSEVYGLSATPIEANAPDRRNYARYYPRRMPAEVLADAVDTVTGAYEKYPGLPKGVRAIELPDEAVNSYFLEVFGRSRRESPCECERSYAPNLAQTLHLMNSTEIQNKLSAADGRLAKLAASGKSPPEMVEELYLVALGRTPGEDELREASDYLASASNKRAALGDLAWVLLNSKEFVFNH